MSLTEADHNSRSRRADGRQPRASALARHLLAALAWGNERNVEVLADPVEAGRWATEVAASARTELRAYVVAEAPLGGVVEDRPPGAPGSTTRMVFADAVLADATGMVGVVRCSRSAEIRRSPSLPYTMIAADGAQAVVAWPHSPSWGPAALLVRPSLLLTLLIDAFEATWAHADPVHLASPDRYPPTVPLPAENQDLLALLTLGGTDQSIAKSLHLSTRSVQRRIAALMDLLDVQSRFQIGFEAARRGWV